MALEGQIDGSDPKNLQTRLGICSKTKKMKGQGLGGRGLIVEITGKCQAGSPRFVVLHCHCLVLEHIQCLSPSYAGLLLDWMICAAVLSGLLLFMALNVQLQPDCIMNSLLNDGVQM